MPRPPKAICQRFPKQFCYDAVTDGKFACTNKSAVRSGRTPYVTEAPVRVPPTIVAAPTGRRVPPAMLAMMAMAKLLAAELWKDVPHLATVERHDAPDLKVAATL